MSFSSIPDGWPGQPLRATMDASRSAFCGKRALVTGACGFVGGHLVRALHEMGCHVVALDRDIRASRGTLLDLTGLRHEVEMVECDITHRQHIEELVVGGGFNFIFHLAAGATTVEKAMADPYGTILANTMGLVNLAEGARLLPSEKRPLLIYASTDKVYGEAKELPYTEEHDLGGVGVYDAAKLCGDIFAGTYDKALGVRTVVLRMCNIFGPYDLNFDYRLIPKAMRNIFRDGESPELYMNSAEHHRDYLYVEDAVRAYLHIARCSGCHGRVYNLPGTLYSSTPDVLRDIVNFISRQQIAEQDAGAETPLARHEWNRSVRIVPSDPNLITISKQHLDGTRIREEAGFEPAYSFHEGLAATAEFYLWYFSQIAPRPEKEESAVMESDEPCASSHASSEFAGEGGFQTVVIEGLPVSVLCPRTKAQKTSDYIARPITSAPDVLTPVSLF